MDYGAYAGFCREIGYKVEETPHGIWIGPSQGFFNRVPFYETTPPTEQELRILFRRHLALGVTYAAEPGTPGKISHNYIVRDQNYGLTTLKSKGRWSVRRGLKNCQVRAMSFDELQRLSLPLNLDTLARQGRDDPLFSDPDRWANLCQAGARVEGAQAWGAFVGNELGAYIILIRIGGVVNLLYSCSRTSLMNFHPVSALFFTVVQKMIQTPGVETVFNGAQWLTTTEGLDRYKQRVGFEKAPVVFVVRFRTALRYILLSSGGRRINSMLGRWWSNNGLYQQAQKVLDIASLSLKG